MFEQTEGDLVTNHKENNKESTALNTVVTSCSAPAVEGSGGTGISWTGNATDNSKDSANSVDTKTRPDSATPISDKQTVPATTTARPFSRRLRQFSGERRLRHPSKEKEAVLPKSERLYNELMEAVANDNGPSAKSVMRHSQLLADGRLRGLHAAVQRGSNKAAKAILDVEPELIHRTDPRSGNAALLVAIESATVSTMTLLVDRGARLNTRNSFGETAWDVARRAPHENKGLISTLVGLYKQHSCDYHTTPVHEAAAAGDVDKIDFLIEAGLDLWDADRAGYNFIHIAAFNNRTNVILHYLTVQPEIAPMEPDVDRHCKSNGKTALHVAANRGHVESVMALLQCGADLRAVDNGFWTPLHDAVVCRNAVSADKIIRTIHSNYPSLMLSVTTDKEMPLHMAARHGRLQSVEVLLELLADSCGDALSAQDIDGWTPLHSAVESRQPQVVQLIIDTMNATSDVHSLLDLPDKFGRSPLQLAQSLSDSDEVVRVLLSHQQPGRSTSSC